MRTGGYYGRFASAVKAGMGTELKFFDVTHAAQVILAAGAPDIQSLHGIVQGAGENQRLGRKYTIKSISMRGEFTLPGIVQLNAPTDEVRVIVVLDKQCNGTTFGTADLLETANVNSFNNLANKSRFSVLKDWRVALNPAGSSANVIGTSTSTFPTVVRTFEFYKKCNIAIETSGPLATLAEIRSNNIAVFAISRTGTATMRLDARVRYADN